VEVLEQGTDPNDPSDDHLPDDSGIPGQDDSGETDPDEVDPDEQVDGLSASKGAYGGGGCACTASPASPTGPGALALLLGTLVGWRRRRVQQA